MIFFFFSKKSLKGEVFKYTTIFLPPNQNLAGNTSGAGALNSSRRWKKRSYYYTDGASRSFLTVTEQR